MDTVIYDGHCKFCTRGIETMRRLDFTRQLQFVSLHDPSLATRYPELTHDMMMDQMWVVSESGKRYGGADAIRHLTVRLPLLYPFALLMYFPGTRRFWSFMYNKVAANRYRLAGTTCDSGTCSLHLKSHAKTKNAAKI